MIVLLPLLFIPARMILRKRLVPIPAPRVPPSGAAPWIRTPASAQLYQPFPFTQQGNAMFNAPDTPPFSISLNAAPTIANVPSNPWHNSIVPGPGDPRPFATPPLMPFVNSYTGQPQSPQPIPTTPPLISEVQAGHEENQPGQTNGLMPPGNPFAAANQLVDSLNNGTRKRLRRNGLSAASGPIASPEQVSGEFSTGMMVVSDPLLKQYNQNGQTAAQAPEEPS